jgi:hypothetical protein
MNEHYFEERFKTPDNVERTDPDTNSPVVNSDPSADQAPVDAALINETPMDGTVAAIDPLYGPLADEIPMNETPVQEIPMEGTVPVVSSLDKPIVNEAPMGETLYYKAQVGETLTDQFQVSKPIPYQAPMGETITHQAPIISTNAGSLATLLNREESEHFRTRWNEIQGKFVDEPRSAVQQADVLVSEVIEQITHMFATEHGTLEAQWNQGNDVSTEDLRKALQRYRSFFNRLVV